MESTMPSATPLRNSDFRKLLETPRPRDAEGFAKPKPMHRPKVSDDDGGAGAKAKRPWKKPGEKKKEDEDEDGSQYRDRAEERRRGLNPDYVEVNRIASALNGDVDITKLSVEESKFLGGDIEHTHLVKGLDYALLQKERTKLSKEDADATQQQQQAGRPAVPQLRAEDIKFSTPAARHVFDCLFKPMHREPVHEIFLPRRTAFVYDFEPEDDFGLDTDVPTTVRRSKADCPQPQETVFAAVDGGVLERIAKVMSYIKAGAAGNKKIKKKDRDEILGILTGATAGTGAATAGAAAAAHGKAGAAAGVQQAPSQAGAAASAGGDDADDIFGDAGTDYRPALPARKKKQPHATDRSAALQDDDMDLEDGEVTAAPPPPPPPLPPAPPTGGVQGYGSYGDGYGYDSHQQHHQQQQQYYGDGGAAYGSATAAGGTYDGAGGAYAQQQQQQQQPTDGAQAASDVKWRAKPKEAAAREVDSYEDAYAECYPMQAGLQGQVVDSDDEDLTQMDNKNKPGASRYDFNTEEEWQQYKANREQLPKAAFQFGLKRADGRKSHKEITAGGGGGGGGGGPADKREEQKFEQKLSKQLNKIEKILQAKGHDHTGAFAKPPRLAPSEPETPSRRKRTRI